MDTLRPLRDQGFTLLEALVAMTILVMAILTMLGLRTGALIDATQAQAWRIARELAESKLSELRAGAHETMPESGAEILFDDYPEFWAVVLIGEANISAHEADMAERMAYQSDDRVAQQADRMRWQQERDSLRRAQKSGVSYREYQDQQIQEQNEDIEDQIPTEEDLEEVAVIVYFPKVDPDDESGEEFDSYVLKAKVSTMAIRGFTPERAEAWSNARGGATATGTPSSSSAGSSGSPFGGDD